VGALKPRRTVQHGWIALDKLSNHRRS
jgi:hypothetical protein